MPPTKSPARHALSEKSTNARLDIPSPLRNQKPSLLSNNTTRLPTQPPLQQKAIPVPKSSPHAGQKRSRELFEEVPPYASQQSILSVMEDDEMSLNKHTTSMQSTAVSASTLATSQTSFSAFQKEDVLIEETFEIQEEMSQRALTELHTVALSQGHQAPQSLRSIIRPSLLKDASLDSVGMSKFIDFDVDASSQSSRSQAPSEVNDDGMKMIEVEVIAKVEGDLLVQAPPQSASDPVGHALVQNRKATMDEKAAILRTRLQLAIYKVQTNQAFKPFSRLSQPPTSVTPPQRSSSPAFRKDSPSVSSGDHDVAGDSSPETHIAIARARATMQTKPLVKRLSSMPVPVIVPTAFSARYNTGPNKTAPEPVVDVPSSPPISSFATEGKTLQQPQTPYRPEENDSKQDVQEAADSGAKRGNFSYGGLTSSVVKDEAASSLLKLMRAGSAGD